MDGPADHENLYTYDNLTTEVCGIELENPFVFLIPKREIWSMTVIGGEFSHLFLRK